ncbi:heparinase II/III family protein [Paracraurococcus lichenis]|uniref:Heparinase II/III-family protein n=1 Tax=Paracraurococcus lichenis TaxID=3064888 RepID=A0ABT9E660_9PROT|nr:heparinase II/III-family protein [Paracraurococcus sp. LOR1-02]MDO9711666.1 heparinase II/III-family protein [Paracraurococcus sp. LOR1-02]
MVVDAARRLGPRPVLLAAWHRVAGRRIARARLRDAALPDGPFLPAGVPPARGLPAWHRVVLLSRAAGVAPPDWHGPFPADGHALHLDLFQPGDIRPVWERNRWAELPLLAQAARLDPGGGHPGRAEALLADWLAANPPFRGPNWACGQEAALRALHLGLALALLGAERALPPGARALLALHGCRIAATPAYALAQDNNHTVSEAAGLMICGLLLGEAGWARRGLRRLEAALLRLVSPEGAFAPLSTGYHRLLLDVLSVAEWLRRRLGGPAPAAAAMERAAAATRWLHRLAAPATGILPRLGHQDGSAFADLALAGPDDARPSLERAARLFCGGSIGAREEPGCLWLGLPAGPVLPAPPAAWAGPGLRGWQAEGARAVLRTGPLRFRPGQADLLHLELWDEGLALLRDGGTGAYNPPPDQAWWHAHFTGTAAHNTIAFDGEDQMPRVSRFLFARWPRTGDLPDGAWIEDWRGRRHARRLRVEGRRWIVEDVISGPFREAVLRWRLAPSAWRLLPDGVEGPLGSLRIGADAPVAVRLEPGWESPAYGCVRPAPVLLARVCSPVTSLKTVIQCPAQSWVDSRHSVYK